MGTAVVTAVVIISCDYWCVERCGLSIRRWVIRRVPWCLPLPAATDSSSREVAAACADQVANFDIVLRHFVENNSGRRASRNDGDA